MRIIDLIRDRARYYNCPVCGRSLRDCELRMLSAVDDRFTVQVTCAACRVQFVVILVVQGGGAESLARDELSLDGELAEDREAVAGATSRVHARAPEAQPEPDPIQPDEVLDVHLLLRDFDGPLTDLVKQPSADRH